jgi:methionyl-tRNA synthetase
MIIDYIPQMLNIAASALAFITVAKGAKFFKEISNLKMEMSRLMDENTDLRNENRELREENRELREDRGKPLEWDGGVYIDEAGGLYCPRCYAIDRKRMRLGKKSGDEDNDDYSCPNCERKFHKKLPPEVREVALKWLFGR